MLQPSALLCCCDVVLCGFIVLQHCMPAAPRELRCCCAVLHLLRPGGIWLFVGAPNFGAFSCASLITQQTCPPRVPTEYTIRAFAYGSIFHTALIVGRMSHHRVCWAVTVLVEPFLFGSSAAHHAWDQLVCGTLQMSGKTWLVCVLLIVLVPPGCRLQSIQHTACLQHACSHTPPTTAPHQYSWQTRIWLYH